MAWKHVGCSLLFMAWKRRTNHDHELRSRVDVRMGCLRIYGEITIDAGCNDLPINLTSNGHVSKNTKTDVTIDAGCNDLPINLTSNGHVSKITKTDVPGTSIMTKERSARHKIKVLM
jgi:azurin